MRNTLVQLGMLLVVTTLISCRPDSTETVQINPMNDQQDFRFEAPEGTHKARLTITGDVSTSYQVFVSDGLYTSRWDYAAGPVDDVKEFEWYDSPLLVNYIPDPNSETTGNLSISCRFFAVK